MRYYKNSTGIVYDLISEGPIKLVNGLNSIYLNRRPIANASVSRAALGVPTSVYLNSDGSRINSGTQRLGITGYFPILLQKAAKQSTVTVVPGNTITLAGFFTTSMLASNTDGDAGLYQKIRIPGAGVDGAEYEGEVLSIAGNTATMDTPISVGITGPIYWDHFAYGIEFNTSGQYYIGISPSATNSALYNPTTNTVTSTAVLGAGIDTTGNRLNFKDVKINFRNGTANQAPVANTAGFSSASYGIALSAELTQVTNIPSNDPNDATPVTIFNTGTNPWWTNDNASIQEPTTGGSPLIINTGNGANGLNIGSPSEIDEVVITINAPEGIYGIKENQDQSKTDAGAIFQVYLTYKVSAAASFQRKLILGPSTQEIKNAKSGINQGLFVHNSGALRTGGNPTGVIKARVDSAVNFDFRINLQEFRPFDDFTIEIYKITPDRFKVGKWVYFQKTVVTAVQAYVHDKLSYPYSAYAAIEFNSQEFQGDIPERAYHCYGVETDLPVNYVTREESSNGVANYNRSGGVDTGVYQVWNGTFRRGYSNNPVWNLREILLNNRWGLGNWLTADQINKYSLYSLARYCDELVPDGKGGLEPRFTCGVYLTQATEAYKVIKDFATTMLALPYWVDGEFILEGDRPGEPVYTFTKGNIEGGIFSYEGTGNRTRVNQIAVTYNDRDNFYEKSVELIDDIDNIVLTNRLITEEVVAFGATSRSQAIRYGKWKLLTAKLQKEVVSFKTGENAGYLKPGSIINIQDAARDRVRYSGRVVSATTSQTTIDKAITLYAGETYELHVFVSGSATYLLQESAIIGGITYSYGDILPITTEEAAAVLRDDSNNEVKVQFSPDSHLATSTITNLPGTYSVLNAAFTTAPESEVIWAVTSKTNGVIIAGSPKMYRILGIGEDNGVYTITAVEHFNSKFDLVDEDYLSDPPQYVNRYIEVPPITNFTATLQYNSEGISEANAGITADIMLSWNPPLENNSLYSGFNGYEIKYDKPDGSYSIITIPSDSIYYEIKNAPEGLHNFSIQAFSSTGPVSTAKTSQIVVSKENYVPGKSVEISLLKGGVFNKPINFSSNSLNISSTYKFTAPSGVQKVLS